jgi:hypothetical protein
MSADQISTPAETAPANGRRLRSTLLAAGAALGMTLAGLGVAQAQTEGGTEQPPAAEPERKMLRHKGGGRGHHGFGMGIRGEAVTRRPGGGFQTIAHQIGEVTEVSATSINVKSEDGFERTYVVNDDTLVNAGNDGIADVKAGDRVRLTAIVADGGQARAVDVHDVTRIRESRQRWMPGPPPPAQEDTAA